RARGAAAAPLSMAVVPWGAPLLRRVVVGSAGQAERLVQVGALEQDALTVLARHPPAVEVALVDQVGPGVADANLVRRWDRERLHLPDQRGRPPRGRAHQLARAGRGERDGLVPAEALLHLGGLDLAERLAGLGAHLVVAADHQDRHAGR